MTRETTIRAIGNSSGTTIPKGMLERYRLSRGDRVHLLETEEGILITLYDPLFSEAMESHRESARRYGNAMRELVYKYSNHLTLGPAGSPGRVSGPTRAP